MKTLASIIQEAREIRGTTLVRLSRMAALNRTSRCLPGLITVTVRHGLMGNHLPFGLHLGEDFPVDGCSAAFQP
ncbi:hypothetical protein H1S01_01495 [Heliobacterium chlorum]|uniref:Uncharacterized protein n=1 Tax=Heliobacterium chlorum TaxID=2698 RepID=A0ABR7SXK5_HELCL|nr:hypothetical protein [Heliobacterium chlorum]MBC9783181.1 hypothetical protein [Heliobacterium chlorum]